MTPVVLTEGGTVQDVSFLRHVPPAALVMIDRDKDGDPRFEGTVYYENGEQRPLMGDEIAIYLEFEPKDRVRLLLEFVESSVRFGAEVGGFDHFKYYHRLLSEAIEEVAPAHFSPNR